MATWIHREGGGGGVKLTRIYVARWLSGYEDKYSAVKPQTTVAAHCELLKLARQLAKSQSNRIDFRRSFWVQSSREARRRISRSAAGNCWPHRISLENGRTLRASTCRVTTLKYVVNCKKYRDQVLLEKFHLNGGSRRIRLKTPKLSTTAHTYVESVPRSGVFLLRVLSLPVHHY